jgi:hypothetical protein
MFHNNGEMTNLGDKLVFEFEECPQYDNEGGVGGLNCTPHLVKPLMILTLFPIL